MNGAIAIGVGIFVLLAIALALAYSHVQQAQRNEMRRMLIEKFGSSQDLGAFLQSPGGRQLMSDLSTGSAAGTVLSSVQKGIVLLAVGFGFAGAGGMNSNTAVAGIGLIIGFSGVGFLVSAGVTYFLSKAMGLTTKRQEN